MDANDKYKLFLLTPFFRWVNCVIGRFNGTCNLVILEILDRLEKIIISEKKTLTRFLHP